MSPRVIDEKDYCGLDMTRYTIAPETICRFCRRPFSAHMDPPTQRHCETDCLGSVCNFQALEVAPKSMQQWRGLTPDAAAKELVEATAALEGAIRGLTGRAGHDKARRLIAIALVAADEGTLSTLAKKLRDARP